GGGATGAGKATRSKGGARGDEPTQGTGRGDGGDRREGEGDGERNRRGSGTQEQDGGAGTGREASADGRPEATEAQGERAAREGG
ncbi:hypothetical protein C3R44_23335, partial [Mycobacterium tuberculosis]